MLSVVGTQLVYSLANVTGNIYIFFKSIKNITAQAYKRIIFWQWTIFIDLDSSISFLSPFVGSIVRIFSETLFPIFGSRFFYI